MTVDLLLPIVRSQLKRQRIPTNRIDLPVNAEDSVPGQSFGAVLGKEEFEQELLLSPLFTPEQEDRAACEPVLASSGLTAEQQSVLIAALTAETPSFPVSSGTRSGFCPIPGVVIDRYVRLLGLDLPVDPQAAEWIAAQLTGADRDLAMSLARRPVWQTRNGRVLLLSALGAMIRGGTLAAVKMTFLAGFVRTYRCRGEADLIRSLASLLESYRIDSEHPLFENPALEEKQGESIRSQYCDETVRLHRVSMARALLDDFGKNSAPP